MTAPPIDALPQFPLGSHAIATRFRQAGAATFHEAADLLWRLPYGRNANREDPLLVLEERCGTCSSKHAALAMLAAEQGTELDLRLGIYLMNGRNTPGIGHILERAGLAAIPEAHCYVRAGGRFLDLTHPPDAPDREPISVFLHEERIAPWQVSTYKPEFHRRFLETWDEAPRRLDAGAIWAVREECIAALSAPRVRRR